MTYTFSNSSTADATQVNQNFTDVLNGLSDGTKNISVSAGTFAGTLNAQGAVTIGASTSNALTINAALSSSIAIGTTFSYDVGSGTIGLKSVYFGSSDSAARTTRLIGATVASSWTMTLPTGTGSANQVLQTDGSGVTSWVGGASLVMLSAQTASSSATIDFTSGITSTYDEYEIHFIDVTFSNNTGSTGCWLRVSEDAGSTWKSGSTDYAYCTFYSRQDGTSGIATNSTGDTKIALIGDGGNTTNAPLNGRVVIGKPSGASHYKLVKTESVAIASDGNLYSLNGGGIYKSTANAITGLRVLPSTGSFAGGNFYLYGVKKS